MGIESLPLEGHETLSQGSFKGFSFPRCKRKSWAWLSGRYGAWIPGESAGCKAVCSSLPPV